MFGLGKVENQELMLKKRQVELNVKMYEAEMQALGNKQRNEYECEWHAEREAKRVALAKLDALVEAKRKEVEEWAEAYEKIIAEKNRIIETLTKALTKGE